MATTQLSFTFVLVKTPPDRAESDDPIWRYVVPYMRFRHPDARGRHWVLCVRDALKILLDALSAAPGAGLGEVHVYSHAHSWGSLYGRLASGDETYRELKPDEVMRFRANDATTLALGKKGDDRTSVHVHGCNLGRSQPALTLWRDLFGGAKGFASAPKLYQMFCAGPLHARATCPGRSTVFLERDIASLAEVDDYVAAVVERAPRYCRSLRPDFAERFKESVLVELDAYLDGMFRKLKDAGEIGWPDAKSLSAQEGLARMRTVFDQGHGIPVTFLSDRLFSVSTLGSACNEARLKQTRGVEVVFPWETARWGAAHQWVPYKP